MNDTSAIPGAPALRGRAVAVAAATAVALGGLIASTAATCDPFPASVPFGMVGKAVLYLAAAAAATATCAAALHAAGRSWASAIAADALTYAPFALLWAAVWLPIPRHLAGSLLWIAAAAVTTAKLALVAGMAGGRVRRIGAGATARSVVAFALWVSAAARLLAPFALIAVATRWQALHLRDGMTAPEQGLLAHAAQALLAGKIPYRDLGSVFAPGAPYLHAGAFAAFGKTLAAGKIALAAGPVVLPLAVYGVSRVMLPAGLAFAAALLAALAGEGNPSVFLGLSAIAMGFARSGSRRANWFTVGLLIGFALAFDMAAGVAVAAALALMLWLRQRTFVMRRVGAQGVDLALGLWALTPLMVGVVVVWGPLLVYFASRGALRALGTDLAAGAGGAVFALLRPATDPVTAGLQAAIYAGGLALLGWRLVHRRVGEAEFAALTVIAFGAVMWSWSRLTADAYHFAQSVPMAMMTAGLVFGWSAKALAQSLVGWPPWDHLRAVRAWVVALVLTGVVASAFSLGWGARTALGLAEMVGARPTTTTAAWAPLDLPAAGGVWVPPDEARDLRAVADFLQKRSAPEEPVFCAPGRPDLYFLADRPNATRLDYVYQGQAGAGDMAQAVVDLETDRTRLVVLAPPAARWQQGLALDPLIGAYLTRRYQAVARFGEYVVLLRKGETLAPRPPTPSPMPPAGSAPPPSMFGPREH
jgi:hypothetical protein